MNNLQLTDVVKAWYLRKWKVIRALTFGCVGLVSLVLLIVFGATLEGGSGVAFPLVMALALGVPTFFLARYAHRRVTQIDDHALVASLRDRPGDVAIVDRSTTIVSDLSFVGLLVQRKEQLPCLKFRLASTGKRYLVPMSDEECDSFISWLGIEQATNKRGAGQPAAS